jgi:serine/threonine protein kinase
MLLPPSMPDRYPHADATLPRASGALRGLATGDLVADRYRLVSVLGRGGMGEVWEAHHGALDRRVALKLVDVGAEPMRARLLHEARLLASLRHPSIVAVHDAGVTADGVAYLAMDILVGDSLATRLARARLDVPIAAALFVEVLDGLVAAHAAGIVHRDIKPDNIVLAARDGVVVPTLIDFGIAVPLVGDGVAPERAGTPQYMAPEQLRGLACDARTDVWSSCVSLYEAITGRLPFMGPDLATTASNVLDAPLAYPTDVAAMDGKLWTILTHGLRKDPADRIASAAELRQALSAWLARRTVVPSEPPEPPEPPGPEPRTPSASNALEILIKRKLTGV